MIDELEGSAINVTDPWQAIEIDATIRERAEKAAAATGLPIEQWLERAICRACSLAATGPLIPTEAGAAALTAAQDAPGLETQQTAADSFVEPVDAETHAPSALSLQAIAQKISLHWALLGAGIAAALLAGVISAQYLIPDRSGAIRVALGPTAAPSLGTGATPAETVSTQAASSSPPPPAIEQTSAPSAAAPPPPSSVAALPQPSAPNAAPATASQSPATASPNARDAAKPAAPNQTPQAKGDTPASAPRQTALAKPPQAPAVKSPPGKAPDKTGKVDNAEPPTDPQKLAPWLEQRAGNGDAVAQYRLGVLYALGEGVTQDYQRAAALFKAAATAGVTEAEYNIAVMYSEGLGVDRDPSQAMEWYRKSAAQGSGNAAFNLGVAYSNGVGVEQSMEQAAQWFRRAAEAGVVNAQFNLGLLYERGNGVPASQTEAYAWYSAAATRGDAGAAQRRDRLASTLSPTVLKDAQTRADQIQSSIQGGAPPTSGVVPAAQRKP